MTLFNMRVGQGVNCGCIATVNEYSRSLGLPGGASVSESLSEYEATPDLTVSSIKRTSVPSVIKGLVSGI